MPIPWTAENAAHLLRRAGFGARPLEIQAAVDAGLDATVDALLVADPTSDALPFADPSTAQLQGWWLHRMATTKSPLVEKLVLFFHDHFATAASKVKKKLWMHAQNRTLRNRALGKFRDLLRAMTRDPALLRYLDNQLNVKQSPNENFARELQELFTTGAFAANGQPNYSEKDVSECARAFTGWTVKEGEFLVDSSQHDDGTKAFKGVTGKLDGDDVVEILAEQPATARRLAKRLWSFFAHPVALDSPIVVELAGVYLAADTDLRVLLRHLFRHEAFYSLDAKRGAVRMPAEFLVVALRGLDAKLAASPAKWVRLGRLTAAMGQALFEPPSVFGWPAGNTWVELSGLHQRLLAAEWIADCRSKKPNATLAWDPLALLASQFQFHGESPPLDAAAVVQLVLDSLGPLVVRPSTRAALVEYATDGSGSKEIVADKEFADRKVRGLVALAMASPEYQIAYGGGGDAA